MGRAVPAGLERTGDIHPHERTVARAQQEAIVDEFGQDSTAQRGFQRPQPPSLRLSQAEAWHLQKFPSYAVDDVFAETNAWCLHIASSCQLMTPI